MKTRLTYLFIILLLTALCNANFKALSQNKKSNEDVIKISAELVQVDVTVIDKNKKPVSGLKRDDFELYDNGKLQSVTTFAYEESRSRRIEEDAESARALPKAITAGELKRAVAFIVAAQNLNNVLNERMEDNFEMESSLNKIALDTGGKFYRNNNDIKQGLDDLLQINAAYYLLGFQPEEGKWDGRFHTLKVAVRGRPDLTVSTRKGYTARSEKTEATKITNPKVAQVIEAISSSLVRRDIDLQLTPFYSDNSKREPITRTLLHIDASRLNFKQVEGRYKTEIEIVGFVYDSQGKRVDNFSDIIALIFLPKTYEETLKGGLLSSRTMNLKPGVYQLRVFVRETDSGLIGTVNNFIEIPNLKSDRLALSSIFMGAQSLTDKAAASNTSTLSQRRYPSNSQLDYLFLIYNAKDENKTAQLEMSLRIMKGRQMKYSSPFKPVEAMDGSLQPSRIITGGSIVLQNFAPGDYTLEVIVKDKLEKKSSRGVVRQEIDFSIE